MIPIETPRTLRLCASLLAAMSFAAGAFAQPASAPASGRPAAAPAASAAVAAAGDMTEAEVRKVDKAAGRITLKHGEIRNLDMPAMTMAFQVRTPSALASLKPGDKVRFRAEKVRSALVVTDLQPMK